jgi:hypothetical protein
MRMHKQKGSRRFKARGRGKKTVERQERKAF